MAKNKALCYKNRTKSRLKNKINKKENVNAEYTY